MLMLAIVNVIWYSAGTAATQEGMPTMKEPKLLVVIDTTSYPLTPHSQAREVEAQTKRIQAIERALVPPSNWELVYIPAAKRLRGGGTWEEAVHAARSELKHKPPIAKFVIISKADQATATRRICQIVSQCSSWIGMYHLPYADLR